MNYQIDVINQIKNEKKRDLLNLHRTLLIHYLKTKKQLSHKVRHQFIKYYDSQINEENIEQHYNQPIQLFLNHLIS